MKQFKRRKSERQFVWEYLRRNKIVKIEDMLPLVDMSLESLRQYFVQLVNAGYVKARKPIKGKIPKKFTDRRYVLVKNTGIIAPVWVAKQKRLYDRNTEQFSAKFGVAKLPEDYEYKGDMKPVKPLEYAKGRIVSILEDEDWLSILALSQRSGVVGGKFAIAIKKLVEDGVVIESSKDSMPHFKLKR